MKNPTAVPTPWGDTGPQRWIDEARELATALRGAGYRDGRDLHYEEVPGAIHNEGHGRWHYQENIHYCRISRGSVDELIDDFNTCQDEGYGDQALVGELKVEAYDLIRRINSYIAYLRKSKQGDGE